MPATGILDDNKPQAYNYYNSDNDYSADYGLLILPVAGPDGSIPRVIKTHASIGYRVTEFNAGKNGTPPVLPAMGNTPTGDVMVASVLNISLPKINSSQSAFNYQAKGRYTYVQSVADSFNVDGSTKKRVDGSPRAGVGLLRPDGASELGFFGGVVNTLLKALGFGGNTAGVGNTSFQTGCYPFNVPLIDLSNQLGNVIGGPRAPDATSPLTNLVDFTTNYSYFSTEIGNQWFARSMIQ